MTNPVHRIIMDGCNYPYERLGVKDCMLAWLETLKPKELIVIVVIVSAALLVAGFFVYSRPNSEMEQLQKKISQLEGQVDQLSQSEAQRANTSTNPVQRSTSNGSGTYNNFESQIRNLESRLRQEQQSRQILEEVKDRAEAKARATEKFENSLYGDRSSSIFEDWGQQSSSSGSSSNGLPSYR